MFDVSGDLEQGLESELVLENLDTGSATNTLEDSATIDVDANTSKDLATVDVDANTLEELVLFLESETESDLGVDIALPNPDSCDISVMMFRDHILMDCSVQDDSSDQLPNLLYTPVHIPSV